MSLTCLSLSIQRSRKKEPTRILSSPSWKVCSLLGGLQRKGELVLFLREILQQWDPLSKLRFSVGAYLLSFSNQRTKHDATLKYHYSLPYGDMSKTPPVSLFFNIIIILLQFFLSTSVIYLSNIDNKSFKQWRIRQMAEQGFAP